MSCNLKSDINGRVYPMNTVNDVMRNWMDQLKGSKDQIGEIFYMDFLHDDGQVHLKTNRKRITLQFDWMEEVNYGTYFD